MRGLFSYDSKAMQALMFVADLAILNILFILCCIPIVTFGAAQAGLHTGIRVLLDKENDSSPAKAFFKGFADGFRAVTLICVLLTVLTVILINSLIFLLHEQPAPRGPIWVAAIGLLITLLFQSVSGYFHAYFQCTAGQLLHNTFYVLLAHPIACVLLTVLMWLPAGIAVADPLFFLVGTPVWLMLYYGLAAVASHYAMKRTISSLKVTLSEPREGSR